MVKALIIGHRYVPSETIETQGKRKEMKSRYRKYNDTVENNGYWVFTKNTRFEVTLSWGDGCLKTFNMRSKILKLYGRKRATKKLLDTFVKDVEEGKYEILMDDCGKYKFKPV